MAIPITVPRLGWSMEEGTFVEWLKKEGDEVKAGEPLYVLESEKASEPVEAIDSGFLRLTAESPKAGDLVKVGQVLAYFVTQGEQLSLPSTVIAGGEGDSSNRRRDRSPVTPILRPQQGRGESGGHTSSPRARRAARELGIDLSSVHGTGRDGRIRERDVRAATPETDGKLLPHSRIRKAIAARMVAGVTIAAPVTLHTRVDATNLMQWRERLAPKPAYSDLILELTARTLCEHPMLQAQWRDEGLWLPPHINIALAVDTDAGLLAPVVRNADRLSVTQIARQTRELAEKARSGRLTADEQRDATFTITNLGMYGVDAFTPIITLPQCAVLGVGRIVREPAVISDRIEPRSMLNLSLTFDHRVIDGAPAARFLHALARLIVQGES